MKVVIIIQLFLQRLFAFMPHLSDVLSILLNRLGCVGLP